MHLLIRFRTAIINYTLVTLDTSIKLLVTHWISLSQTSLALIWALTRALSYLWLTESVYHKRYYWHQSCLTCLFIMFGWSSVWLEYCVNLYLECIYWFGFVPQSLITLLLSLSWALSYLCHIESDYHKRPSLLTIDLICKSNHLFSISPHCLRMPLVCEPPDARCA